MLRHQTFSPTACDCVIEEQFELHDDGSVDQPTLCFFHTVCSKHEPLVKNKPKLNKNELDKKKKEVIDQRSKLLADNRIKNLKQYDDNPQRKQIEESIKEIKLSQSEKLGLKLEAKFKAERLLIEAQLDRHEEESMDRLLLGIHSPYAFIAQEVYDAIRNEQKANV